MNSVSLGYMRVSSALQYNRSYASLSAQTGLLAKYEQQLMSEVRYQYGSDAPTHASITLTTQMVMERKAQNSMNLNSAQAYLTTSDSTLSKIGALMNEARASALDGLNTTTSAPERTSLALTIKNSLQQTVNFGNTNYQNRYLFSGATTDVQAFTWNSNAYALTYTGSVQHVYTWTDTDSLTATNMSGDQVFGALSDPIASGVDFNPAITYSTQTSALDRGAGIDKGAIRLTFEGADGIKSVDVDLGNCATVGDIRSAIVKNAAALGASVEVDLTAHGFAIAVSGTTPGSLSIGEVGKGAVARQLGIVAQSITPAKPLIGKDLDPAVTPLTSLESLFGSKARTSLTFAGTNNNILIEAKRNGAEAVDPETGKTWPLNGIEIVFIADGNIEPGSEYADFDEETRQLTVHVHPDSTTSNDVVAAFNRASDAGEIPPLQASLDPLNQEGGSKSAGTGLIGLLPGIPYSMGTTAYGSGETFDKDSGIRITNANQTYELDFSDCSTVSDMLAALNDPKYGLHASINVAAGRLDVRTRVSGTDFMIGENGGKTATQLGIRSMIAETKLDDLDFGRGVMDDEGPGTQAKAVYESNSANSALLLTAKNEGARWNDYVLDFVETNDPNGAVTVAMDEENQRITIGINHGVTTACEIVAAFAEQPGAQEFFTLQLDESGGTNSGLGVVYTGSTTTSGGEDGGIDFTITRNDGLRFNVDIHGAETVGDVIDLINAHPGNVGGLLAARLNENGNGIELVDRSVGDSTMKVERTLLSTAAIDLGLIPRGEEFAVPTDAGSNASVTFSGAANNSSLFVAGKSTGEYANGVTIELVDMNVPGGSGTPTFRWDPVNNVMRFEIDPAATTANDVIALFQSQASESVRHLFNIQNATNPDGSSSDGTGLVDLTDPVDPPTLDGGNNARLGGRDPNPLEADSLHNALIRMQLALENNDARELERSVVLLDTAIERMDSARTEIGIRQTGLDSVHSKLEDEYVQNTQALLDHHEIDVAETTLNYMTAQLAYEANLSVAGRIFQLSLMNYI